jgi:hypothetical protein
MRGRWASMVNASGPSTTARFRRKRSSRILSPFEDTSQPLADGLSSASRPSCWSGLWSGATPPRSNADHVSPKPSPAPQARASEVVPAAAPTKGTPREALTAVDSDRVEPSTAGVPATAPLQLRLHATSEVWLQASVDGEQRIYRLVSAGEDVNLDAQREIALRLGDASAVTYTVNGSPGGRWGPWSRAGYCDVTHNISSPPGRRAVPDSVVPVENPVQFLTWGEPLLPRRRG